MYKILVVSHSSLCKGLKEAAEMILGSGEDIHYLSLESDGVETFHQKLQDKVSMLTQNNEELLILADLFGGSPFNRSMLVGAKYKNIKIITGTNLPMIIEAAINKDSNINDVIDGIINSGKEGILEGQLLGNDNADDE